MAKIPLRPLGSCIVHDETFQKNVEKMCELDEVLLQKRQQVKLGWGEAYQERVRKKGKLTAWERVERIVDALDVIFPINTFVNDGEKFGDEGGGRTSPAAGVITAFVKVHDRWTMVIANDNTVASGSWWPRTPEKIIRAQEIALKLSIPVIYLVDCSGLFLPEQAKSFPGKHGAGHIFKMNADLSAKGVPQIAGVFGDCIAGGGYMPLISDKVYMTEQAYMVIAGAALIQGAKSQNLSSLDIGGAQVHVHQSNCADFRVPDDETCLDKLRLEVKQIASSANSFYRNGVDIAPPDLAVDVIDGILSTQPRSPYAIREVIARLVDDGLFWEVLPDSGQEVVVGIGRIAGLYVGIAANVQELTPHPYEATSKRPGGILYREGVAKLAVFSRACNDDGIPLIWLQDVSGFDVGVEAEKQGLLGYGSSLIYSNTTNTTPMVTVLLRKASGAGYYAMAGLPYEPVLQLATPLSRLAVMEGRTLAIGAYNSKLDDQFQIMTQDPKERAAIETGMAAVAARIEQDMDPYKAARQMDVDEVVRASEIRSYLTCIVEACYQSQGTRRIKNPRIWSLHDLAVTWYRPAIFSPLPLAGEGSRVRVGTGISVAGEEICAPMDGMFYVRPSQNESAFVKENDVVKKGDTLGLIEVMKCFYPIKYEKDEPGVILQVKVKEASSVQSGDVLFVVG